MTTAPFHGFIERTGGAIDGFIGGRQRGNRERVGPLPLSMVSSKGAWGVIDGFIEGHQGGREQGTPHTHNGICVAFHLRFAPEKEWRVPIRLFLHWSIEMKGRVAVTQSSNATGTSIKKRGESTKSKSSATRATSESTNSRVIKQSNNSRGTLLLVRLGIKQQFGYADHARIYDFAERVEDAPIHTIDASVAPAPITEYPE